MYQKALISQGAVVVDPDSSVELQLSILPTWVEDSTTYCILKIAALYKQLGVCVYLCQEPAHLAYLAYRKPLWRRSGSRPLFGHMMLK